jgi:hypothetical protein
MLLVALAAVIAIGAIGVTTALAYDGGEEPAETRSAIIACQPASGTSDENRELVPHTRDSGQILAMRDGGASVSWLYPSSQSER